jgi:hypothetical protein
MPDDPSEQLVAPLYVVFILDSDQPGNPLYGGPRAEVSEDILENGVVCTRMFEEFGEQLDRSRLTKTVFLLVKLSRTLQT